MSRTTWAVVLGTMSACAAITCASQAGDNSLILAQDGKPAATIVLATNATRAAQFAAAELQFHIAKITGAQLPIIDSASPVKGVRILVGASPATQALGLKNDDFKPQEYLVRFLPETIVLMGRDKDDRAKMDYNDAKTYPDLFDEQGTCYAVYDFLEKFCEVRWYLPTELGIACPVSATLKVTGGADIRRAPAMKYRFNCYAYPADLCGDSLTEPVEPPKLSARETGLFWRRLRMGGQPYAANHSFYGYYDRYLTNHPDWFAQGYSGRPPQLCFTHPEVIKQVIQDARDYFDGKGVKGGAVAMGDTFGLVPMDNSSWCKCARCRALIKQEPARGKDQFSNDIASDYMFTFVNQVAREVKKTHPDKWLSALAYSSYAYPPSKERLESNVTIQFCLHARMVYSPAIQQNDIDIINAWRADSLERPKYLWLYYCFPALSARYSYRCFPGFFAHSIVTQMARYYQAGVRGIFYEVSTMAHHVNSPVMDMLENYITWKLADDPTLDGNQLINECFTRFYGAAAKPMQGMYDDIETIYSDPANYPKDMVHQTEKVAWGSLGTDARMDALSRKMEEAKKLAATDLEKQRVALFEKAIWRYMENGKNLYREKEKRMAPTLQKITAPKVSGAELKGDPNKVDWSKGALLGTWYTLNGEPSSRKVEGHILHDGDYLYLQLEENTDPKKLVQDGSIFTEDEWELFVARQRSKPYRQLGVNAKGQHEDLAWGEGGERHKTWDSGVALVSDTKAADRWVVCLAFPLAKLLPDGVKSGDTIYMNFFRTTRQQNTAEWVPNMTASFHEPSRLGEVVLAP